MTGISRDFRTRRFWRHIAISFFATIGVLASAVQLYEVFKPGEVASYGVIVVWSCIGASVISALVQSWPRPIQQHFSTANTQIRVIEGDLFDQPGDLVISTCDTFDTLPPHIIDRRSIQGQFLDRVYAGDIAKLDADLSTALIGIQSIGTIAKPGKSVRYPVGTIAVLPDNVRRFYFVALTEMDMNNVAQATIDGYWRSLEELWRSVIANGNGSPIAAPVMGGGLSRLAQLLPAQDSIRLMALSFMFASRRTRVCERLDIIVRKQDIKNLDMLEIQAFLKSLRAS